MKKGLILLLLLIAKLNAFSQTHFSLREDLLKLKNTTTILYLAAHPDDENNLLIGYLAKGKHYRTIYLSLSRGDGGQNLIGTEQGVELGILRTQELLKARSTDGGEQLFSHAYDFGFSKSAEETFEHWHEAALLKDVIQAIRINKPEIIICRFPADKRAGHGHHIASAMIGKMAYLLAGDDSYKIYYDKELGPSKSNELIKLKPWKADALLWNIFDKNDSTKTDAKIKLTIAGIDSSSGKTFQELAADSRSMHKCQGFGVAPDYTSTEEYFEVIEKKDSTTTIDLDHLKNQKWLQEKNGKQIIKSIDDLINNERKYSFESTLDKLFAVRNQLKTIDDKELRNNKAEQIETIIKNYSQLRISCFSKNEHYGINEAIQFTLAVFNPQPTTTFQLIANNDLISVAPLQNVSLPKSTVAYIPSQPFWLSKPIQQDLFSFDQNGLIHGNNLNSHLYNLQLIWKKDTLNWDVPINYQYVNPKSGEEKRSLIISDGVYSASVNSTISFQNKNTNKVTIQITNPYNKPYQCRVKPVFSNNEYQSLQKDTLIHFSSKGESKIITFDILKNNLAVKTDLTFTIVDSIQTYSLNELREIQYPHIDKQHYFKPVTIQLLNPSFIIKTNKVAYLMGSGDKIPDVLKTLGIEVDIYKENELAKLDLNQYKVIIAGVRLYNTNKEIHTLHNKLNDFIFNGGKYIVQYNTSKESNIGPYPFKVGKSRVTEEYATVSITDSLCKELNYPNKITTSDFDNWTQERGIYFVENIDSNFIAPLQMNDRNENPHQGSLIIANYGKGKFIYTGISFFRQLPAHVEGATKLFLNLIAE
jgi:LmbE family N-acetylglucosaminyl deacetylase